jgi:(2R)-3-sulfolactate dehydrogenase (NADP+)
MVPAAGHKGSALALLVDIMSGAVAGSNFSHEAPSFVGPEGGAPDVGQVVVAIDPSVTTPHYLDRLEHEFTALAEEPGVRLPGDRRHHDRTVAEASGVVVPHDLMSLLTSYTEPVR